MKFFLGIVPSNDIYNTIVEVQRQFGDNRLEPHITLRPPIVVRDEWKWTKAIVGVCSVFSPFTIELPKTGYFGKRVLFIDVVSSELRHLQSSLLTAIQLYEIPDRKEDENKEYHPHLTLGRSWCGFSKNDFAGMKAITDTFLSEKKVSFTAKAVRIYHKPTGTGRFAPKEDIFL